MTTKNHKLPNSLYCGPTFQVDGETLAAMDKVLRHVRQVDQLFGGVFILGAGDHYQCGSIGDVHPPLTTVLVRHNFDSLRMQYLFRYPYVSPRRPPCYYNIHVYQSTPLTQQRRSSMATPLQIKNRYFADEHHPNFAASHFD